jgi:hypothetical protein
MRVLIVFLITAQALVAQTKPKCVDCVPRNSHERSAYKKYIEPLLSVRDFHMSYADDGAADATVTCPGDCSDRAPSSVPEVATLMKNPTITVPLLIDCLDDNRLTSVRFVDNEMIHPMQVPVGYVCLDILMSRFVSEPIAENDCRDDGIGACMNLDFYFRPDDYYHCFTDSCVPRPWVLVVQKNWRRELQSGRLWNAQAKRSKTKSP